MRKEYVFTQEQIAEMTRRYPNEFACDIAESMGIPIYTFNKKCRELGLKKADGFRKHSHYGILTRKGDYSINQF